jgi:hypothetical protein
MATVAQRLQAERLKYPGLLPDEIIVFRAWLKLHESEFDSFDYNVRIGQGQDPGPTFSDEVRRAAILNSQLRIDAVARKGGTVSLIEVKRRAAPANIGQLVVYQHVWIGEHPGDPPPDLIMVSNVFTPHILPAVRELKIRLDVVQADFSELRVNKGQGLRSDLVVGPNEQA